MKKQSLGLWSKSLGNSNTKGYTEVGETLLNSSHRVKMLKYHTGRQKKTIHIRDLNNRRQESIILVFPELQSLHNKNLSAEHWKLQNLGELGDGNDQSVQFSHSVVSDSLWPHELQHARLSCPSPTPGAYSNSCLSSRWCHPTISSSVIPFSSCLQSFSASGLFYNESVLHIRWPKYWSFSFSISPSSEYSGLISFRMDWLDLLAVQGTLKSLLQHHSSKVSILQHS